MRAHCKNMKISFVNAGQMKRLVNESKNFALLIIKKNNDIDYEYFEGCDYKLKSYLFDVVRNNGEMFQETKGLPPNIGIQHEIHLSIMKSREIKRKIPEFLNKGIICPSTSPCGSPIDFVPKKGGSWCTFVDFRLLNEINGKGSSSTHKNL